MMTKHYSGKPPLIDVNLEWRRLVDTGVPLYVSTLQSREHSRSLLYIFRNRILDLVSPKQLQFLNLSFDIKGLQEDCSPALTLHGGMIVKLMKVLPKDSLCLILDSDAFPLSAEGLKLSFIMASIYGVAGNAQRTNCIENNCHLFAGPSYLCFKAGFIQALGDDVWQINGRSDVGEEIFWRATHLNSYCLFMPIRTLMRPVWALNADKPVYGIGTFFGHGNIPVSYHHFYSRILVSRVHFFLVSFWVYIRVGLGEFRTSSLRSIDFRQLFKSIAKEVHHSILYIAKGALE